MSSGQQRREEEETPRFCRLSARFKVTNHLTTNNLAKKGSCLVGFLQENERVLMSSLSLLRLGSYLIINLSDWPTINSIEANSRRSRCEICPNIRRPRGKQSQRRRPEWNGFYQFYVCSCSACQHRSDSIRTLCA